MSKFIRFINQSIKHFFIIDGEVLDDGCNEFKNGLPDSFTDSQFVTVFGSLSVPPWRCVSLVFCGHSFLPNRVGAVVARAGEEAAFAGDVVFVVHLDSHFSGTCGE